MESLKTKATEQLRNEHEGVLLMLEILNRIADIAKTKHEIPAEHLASILDFLKVFVDRCHHGKEEEYLFPLLESKGISRQQGPIGVMLSEHEQGRTYIRQISDSLDEYKKGNRQSLDKLLAGIESYTQLLGQHINKENHVLFAFADRLLSSREQDALYENFEKIENEKIGQGTHEKFHHLIHDLRHIYLGGSA